MNMKQTILVIEDEESISNFIHTILTANGYRAVIAKNGKEALSLLASHCPDVVLLDLGLPDMDGAEIIRSVRSWSAVPVIVVSARGQEEDKVSALDLGADDYITKPFGTSELLARIRASVRHAAQRTERVNPVHNCFQSGDFVIDFDKRQVTVGGREVHLTQIEYKLVSLLSKYPDRVLTYDFLIKNIWGPHAPNDNQILRVNMANIRRKIEQDPGQPKYILTELGVGYRMVEEN